MHESTPRLECSGQGPCDSLGEPVGETVGARAALRLCHARPEATWPQGVIVVVDTPVHLSRVSLYHALGERIGRWGRRHDDLCAFIDLSNHPLLPAQTIVGAAVQSWDDLADGVPQALASSNLLLVIGVERMLIETPHRLAAFLQARARCQTVVVLTALVTRVRALQFRDAQLQLIDSIANESDADAATSAITRVAIAAARKANPRAQLLTRNDSEPA